MQTLTVIIPTYNEAQYLEDALYSVKFADEIIVVDSMSNDDTVKIATDHGCKVITRKFDNFSNQNWPKEVLTCIHDFQAKHGIEPMNEADLEALKAYNHEAFLLENYSSEFLQKML